jgi:hypothetical protein
MRDIAVEAIRAIDVNAEDRSKEGDQYTASEEVEEAARRDETDYIFEGEGVMHDNGSSSESYRKF